MSTIAKALGQRIRNHRTSMGLSQEKLAELSGCHPTYIGQIERGEKNATIESIEKIATALNLSGPPASHGCRNDPHGSMRC